MVARIVSTLMLVYASSAYSDVRVMAVNAEWLWTPKDGVAEGDRVRIKDMRLQDYQEELDYYASLILKSNADVVAFSEIENQSVMEDLTTALGEPWVSYFRQGRDTATGQDVAIVSRLSVVPGSVTDFNFPAGRLSWNDRGKRLSKVLGAVFALPNSNEYVAVLTSHFLSRRNDSLKKSNNRLRQANAALIALQMFDSKITKAIVLGDLNDVHRSAPIRALMEEGGLKSMVDSCPPAEQSPMTLLPEPMRQIDHILFKGFVCQSKAYYDLGKMSDHYAVWAHLK